MHNLTSVACIQNMKKESLKVKEQRRMKATWNETHESKCLQYFHK